MLRGVDIKQVLMQSNSVERVQQVQQQNADMQQRYFSVQLTEERRQAKETIKETEETSKTKIGKEEKERRHKEDKKSVSNNKPGEKNDETTAMMDGEIGGSIDIRV